MKKFFFLLIFISSCKKEVYYYPSKIFFEENHPKEIIIDNLSYSEIVDSLTNQIFKKKRHFFKIEDSDRIYKVSPFTYSGGLIKEINSLDIENESIWWKYKKLPINNLEKSIELHYGNNGKEYFLPYSYKRAFIKLTLESITDSQNFKRKLLNIISAYEKAEFKHKDSCYLNIMLHYYKNSNYQPLPPKPSEIE